MGLSFKAETDDVRESPAIAAVNRLLEEGAEVQAHDPIAIENFRKLFSSISYFENEFDASRGADALVICTDWNEYRNFDLEKIKELMRGNIILDTRNILDGESVIKLGFAYEGVGRK